MHVNAMYLFCHGQTIFGVCGYLFKKTNKYFGQILRLSAKIFYYVDVMWVKSVQLNLNIEEV